MKTTVIGLSYLWNTEIRIGILSESAAQSRTESVAAFSFGFCQSMAARWESRKAHRLPLRGFPGMPILSGCRLDWHRDGSCSSTGTSEAICHKSHQKSSLFARSCLSSFQSSRWALSPMSKILQTLSVLRASFCHPKKHNQLGMTRHAQTRVAL